MEELIIYYIVIFGIAALLALVPANIAKSKGYSFGLWWFYGWMLWIVAVIHVSVIPDKNAPAAPSVQYTQPTPVVTPPHPADEIRKYKELLDQGIITQEEFDAKKKELLR